MEDDLQWKTTSNGRQPLMEDDLKISKVEYLSNHQILNLSSGDKNKIKISSFGPKISINLTQNQNLTFYL